MILQQPNFTKLQILNIQEKNIHKIEIHLNFIFVSNDCSPLTVLKKKKKKFSNINLDCARVSFNNIA